MRSPASPPIATTRAHPAAVSASATRRAIATPATCIVALSLPMRRLAPPHSTAPIGASAESNNVARSSLHSGDAAGVELLQEHRYAIGLVALADGRGHLLQAA